MLLNISTQNGQKNQHILWVERIFFCFHLSINFIYLAMNELKPFK